MSLCIAFLLMSVYDDACKFPDFVTEPQKESDEREHSELLNYDFIEKRNNYISTDLSGINPSLNESAFLLLPN